MEELQDISSAADIAFLVDKFYTLVARDETIGPIFKERLAGKWLEHLKTMRGFWRTVLLGEKAYSGNPFLPHAQLSLRQQDFQVWLSLWKTTLLAHFQGPKTTEAIWRAERMAELFIAKINYYKDKPQTPLM